VISGIARPRARRAVPEELRRTRPDLPAVLVYGFSPGPKNDPPEPKNRDADEAVSMSDLAATARTLLDA